MILTPEQTKKVKEIDKELKEMFPNFYGSVRFNLTPQTKKLNINIVENVIT